MRTQRIAAQEATRVLVVLIVSILSAGIAGSIEVPTHTTGSHPAAESFAGAGFRHWSRSSGDATRRVGSLPDPFLSKYQDPDGRIVRRDQGGDTVSEGQAYGMLTAVAAGDRADFMSIWTWTALHLQREDGLLAWHWTNGRVADEMPASDADLVAAWALTIAGRQFRMPALDRAAGRMASSILSLETTPTSIGPVLVAGPWAVGRRIVNPSYFAPGAFSALGSLTRDPRWSQVESSSRLLLLQFLSAHHLVPDWIVVNGTGVGSPSGPPSAPNLAPSYGLDAARIAIWWASACSAPDRSVAAGEWPRLSFSALAGSFPLALDLSGRPRTTQVNPVIAVADAFSAQAAGYPKPAHVLLSSAIALNSKWPTYYGSAWVSLSELLLARNGFSSCAPF